MGSISGTLMLTIVAAQAINARSWITPQDYPTSALRENRSGHTGFRLTIAPEGKPMRCEIVYESGWNDIDQATCKLLMKRARFKPALDAQGKPTVAVYRNVHSFYIPGGPVAKRPKPPTVDIEINLAAMPSGIMTPADLSLAFAVDAMGAISDCVPIPAEAGARGRTKPRPDEQMIISKLGRLGCAQLTTIYKPIAAIDAKGEPTASIQTAKLRFTTSD